MRFFVFLGFFFLLTRFSYCSDINYYTGLKIGLGSDFFVNNEKYNKEYFGFPPTVYFGVGQSNLFLFKQQKIPLQINFDYEIFSVTLNHKKNYDSNLFNAKYSVSTGFYNYALSLLTGYNLSAKRAQITICAGIKLNVASSESQSFREHEESNTNDSIHYNIAFNTDLGKWTFFPSAVFNLIVGKKTDKLVYPCFFFNADFGLRNIFQEKSYYNFTYTIASVTKYQNAQWQGKTILISAGLNLFFNTQYRRKK